MNTHLLRWVILRALSLLATGKIPSWRISCRRCIRNSRLSWKKYCIQCSVRVACERCISPAQLCSWWGRWRKRERLFAGWLNLAVRPNCESSPLSMSAAQEASFCASVDEDCACVYITQDTVNSPENESFPQQISESCPWQPGPSYAHQAPGTRLQWSPTLVNKSEDTDKFVNIQKNSRPRILVLVMDVLRLCAIIVIALGWTRTWALPSCVRGGRCEETVYVHERIFSYLLDCSWEPLHIQLLYDVAYYSCENGTRTTISLNTDHDGLYWLT